VRRLVLDNGLTVILDRFESPTAAVVVAIGVGSLFEPRERRGITHVLEHMLFRVPGFDVDEAVESLGGSDNAYTKRDALVIAFEALSESASGLVELACRLYTNDRYAEEDFRRELNAIMSELRQVREEPSERVGELGLKAAFGDSEWGDPISGTPETVSAITLRDLVEFKREWFTPDNTILVMTGAFDDNAAKLAVELFGRLGGTAPRKRKPSALSGPRAILERRDVDGVYYARVLRVSVDSPARTLALLHGAAFHLEAGPKSLLFDAVRVPGVAYSYYVDYDVVGDTAYLEVVVESAESLEAARAAVLRALRPARPASYRLRYYEYSWRLTWRSALNRAMMIAEYVIKCGYPELMVEEFGRAAELGTAWLEGRVVDEAEAAIVPAQ
jgi:predicted Zn-dependent peptidase